MCACMLHIFLHRDTLSTSDAQLWLTREAKYTPEHLSSVLFLSCFSVRERERTKKKKTIKRNRNRNRKRKSIKKGIKKQDEETENK